VGRPAKYPEECRREAVALYRSSDRFRAEVAKSLGISDGSWPRGSRRLSATRRRDALRDKGFRPTGHGLVTGTSTQNRPRAPRARAAQRADRSVQQNAGG
jgi:transposase-like protein